MLGDLLFEVFVASVHAEPLDGPRDENLLAAYGAANRINLEGSLDH
jgi:hypothetical protein